MNTRPVAFIDRVTPGLAFRLWGIALFLLASASASKAQILQYTFNEPSGTAFNAGSIGAAGDLALGSAATRSADGAGVSGQAGDYAYVGVDDPNSKANTGGVLTGLNNLTALSITGWLNVSSASFGGSANILCAQSGGFQGGLTLRTETNGQLKLMVGSFSASVSATGTPGNGVYDDFLNEWVFFAVTFDGAASDPAVLFYQGTTGIAASMVSAVNRNDTTTGANNTHPLHIGNQQGGFFSTGFSGMLDDIRVYDSVLDTSSIEAVRQSALIPEPSITLLLLAAGGTAALARQRKVRQQ